MNKSLRSTLVFLLMLAAPALRANEVPSDPNKDRDPCVVALTRENKVPTMSLEQAYPGIAQELYATLDVFNAGNRNSSIDDIFKFYKKLSDIGDKVAPKGNWLRKVEEKARKLDEMFLNGQISADKFHQNLAGLIYEASVATQVPSNDIHFGENLATIARKFQITRATGKKAELIYKEIDLAWYQDDTLFLLEAKNITPYFATRKSTLEYGSVIDEIVGQSKRLKRALKAYDLHVLTILTVRNLSADLRRQIVAGGAAYDHIIIFDPSKSESTKASQR